jgi:hypothetical protein
VYRAGEHVFSRKLDEEIDDDTRLQYFELALSAREREGEITLFWRYSKSVFLPTTIQRMAEAI